MFNNCFCSLSHLSKLSCQCHQAGGRDPGSITRWPPLYKPSAEEALAFDLSNPSHPFKFKSEIGLDLIRCRKMGKKIELPISKQKIKTPTQQTTPTPAPAVPAAPTIKTQTSTTLTAAL